MASFICFGCHSAFSASPNGQPVHEPPGGGRIILTKRAPQHRDEPTEVWLCPASSCQNHVVDFSSFRINCPHRGCVAKVPAGRLLAHRAGCIFRKIKADSLVPIVGVVPGTLKADGGVTSTNAGGAVAPAFSDEEFQGYLKLIGSILGLSTTVTLRLDESLHAALASSNFPEYQFDDVFKCQYLRALANKIKSLVDEDPLIVEPFCNVFFGTIWIRAAPASAAAGWKNHRVIFEDGELIIEIAPASVLTHLSALGGDIPDRL